MFIEHLIETWGIPALAVGGFFEGDTVAMLGGALAHRGHLGFAAAWAAVCLGAFAADQMWFHLARRHRDRPFVARLAARPSALRLIALVRRRPVPAIVGFRFIWGMRTIGPVALGAAGIRPGLFVALNLISVALWGLVMTALGAGLGQALQRLLGHLPILRHLAAVAAAALFIVALAAILHMRATRRRD